MHCASALDSHPSSAKWYRMILTSKERYEDISRQPFKDMRRKANGRLRW